MPKWTVMVFMGVAKIDGAVSLAQEAEDDLNELRKVEPEGDLNIFVQRHDADGGVQRFHIGQVDEEQSVEPQDRDPVGGQALGAFILWALGKAKHTENDRSVLVLWGHAYQFTVGHAPTTAGVEALDFSELAAVLEDIQERARKRYPTGKLDLVAFDACDLSLIEVAHVVHPFAHYLVASEIGIPTPGWPYDRVFTRLKEGLASGTPHPPMTPADLGAFAVRQFCGSYRDRRASLTLLDLGKAEAVFRATEALAKTLAIVANADRQERELIRELFQRSQTLPGRPFIDVADFCVNLSRHCRYQTVSQAASDLGDILIRPGADVEGDEISPDLRPFIVEHGRNRYDTAKLHGVALYAPQVVGPTFDWPTTKEWYDKFAARETVWNKLVHAFAS